MVQFVVLVELLVFNSNIGYLFDYNFLPFQLGAGIMIFPMVNAPIFEVEIRRGFANQNVPLAARVVGCSRRPWVLQLGT